VVVTVAVVPVAVVVELMVVEVAEVVLDVPVIVYVPTQRNWYSVEASVSSPDAGE
jgi:hypothetical protein